MTFKEMQKELLNKKDQAIAIIENEFKIPVKIHDVKNHYGRTSFLVSPQNGQGMKWISEDRIRF